jgi:hypothetical protein
MATGTQPQRGLTFEDLWAALMELGDSQKESKVEHDRMIAETQESQKETARIVKELGKQMGGLA